MPLYLIPRSIRPRPKSNRCLPQYLPYVAQKLAECRQQTVEHIDAITSHNTIDFFELEQLGLTSHPNINHKKEY